MTVTDRPRRLRKPARPVRHAALAPAVVDAGANSRYVSTRIDAALADMGSNVMGLSGDRAQAATQLLTSHVKAAHAKGASASVALQSAFAIACQSPSTLSVGL